MGDKKPIPIPPGLNFVFGGTAGCMATCIVHPMDVLKNRMQVMVQREKVTSFSVFKKVYATEGIKALYKGLTAGLFRQITYSSARLGVYNWLFELAKGPQGQPPNFATKASCGMVAGAFGAFVGNPAEICLIRMTTDGRLPKNERRNYTHVFNAISRIVREEGVLVLWRGTIPTCLRAIVVNATQLGTYSQAKEMIMKSYELKDGLFVHLCASMISGLATSFASLPLDIVKTRLQNMKYVDGKPEYSGNVDLMSKIFKKEGLFAFWKGFTPYYLRIGPHTAKEMFASYYNLKDGLFLHLCASMLSGLATTIASLPLDIVKTRLQNMKHKDGKPEYTGSGDVFVRILKNEGPFALWKGFTPYYCRLAPHTVFLFIFFEQLQRLYRVYYS